MKQNFTIRLLLLWFAFFASKINAHGSEMPRFFQPQTFSYVSSIIPTPDNGFIILGYYRNTSADFYRPIVTKFNQKADVQWEKRFNSIFLFDFTAVDEGLLYKTPDNGYMLVHTYPSTTNNGRLGLIQKFNNNFDSIFSVITLNDSIGFDETFLGGWSLSVNKFAPTPSGGFGVVGSNLKDCYNKGFVLAEYSNTGSLVWKEATPLAGNSCIQFRYDASLVERTSDGGTLYGIGGRTLQNLSYVGNFYFAKKNASGTTTFNTNIITQYDVSQVANKNVLLAQKELANGNFKFLTLYDVNGSDYTGGIFLQYTLSPTGTLISTDTFNFRLPLSGSENLRKVVIDKNENIIILGQKSISKLDKKGRLLWQKTPFDDLRLYDNVGVKYNLNCYTETADGNYILAGNAFQIPSTSNNTSNIALFFVSADGSMKTKILYGSVFVDMDNSCILNTGEKGYQNLGVKAEKNNQSFYTVTDTLGAYALPLDTGVYKVSIQLPNSLYWKTCQPNYTANLTTANPTVNINIPIQPKSTCPFLNVEISTPYLRKCFPNDYSVYYCNSGVDTAKNAYITIDLDSDMEYNSATIPLASFTGNKYRFNIGNIAPQTCGSFKVNATVKCSAIDGKTHCTTAHIYPDSLCTPNNVLYDGSNIIVEGVCDGDTAVFKIKNIGTGSMQRTRKYIVIEGDFLRVAPIDFQLNANDSIVIKVLSQGKTVRVQAQQDPNFPYPSLPSFTIESCTGNIDSLNLVNQFPQDDGAAFITTSCMQNKNSYDPNEKITQPVGYSDEHIVNKQTEIKYTLHFQNCGTDTAYNVVLLDTLSNALDLTTLVMGASSHNYNYAIYNGNVLHVTFNNINLPDSTINKDASNGFVSFHIMPKENVANGTLVPNSAQIYFDYNAAISTNQVYHTIDSLVYKITEVKTYKSYLSDIKIYPNPFSSLVTIELKSEKNLNSVMMKVVDITGKVIEAKQVNTRFIFDGNSLANGLYLLQFTAGNEIIATAKLVKQ
jgi:uncharacterized repeat protein (TIGR01451 family)